MSSGISSSRFYIFWNTIPKKSSSKGTNPHKKLNKIIPQLHKSDCSAECGLCISDYGSEYLNVPLNSNSNSPGFKKFDRPKSIIFKILFYPNKIFSNFKSLCAIPFW